MTSLRVAALLSLPLLTGCGRLHRPGPEAGSQARYVVGPAYQAGDVWFYPREDFRLDATGLAIVLPDRPGRTANNEARSPAALAGAHATLQLPAAVLVTNLESGRQVLIRINDRGPDSPGRLLGLSRHAADLLGIAPGAAARVRLQVEDGPSRALRDGLLGNTALLVANTPRVAVRSEPLPPPPGATQSVRVRIAAATLRAPEAGTPPARTPEAEASVEAGQVRQVPANPGQLWLAAGEFSQSTFAAQVQARLRGIDAAVQRMGQGRSETFRVRAGPFISVEQADTALDRAIRAGVTDARIVVE